MSEESKPLDFKTIQDLAEKALDGLVAMMHESNAAKTRVEQLESHARFVRQQVHQAHHDGPIEGCKKGTCQAAELVLGET